MKTEKGNDISVGKLYIDEQERSRAFLSWKTQW
jgi:hypothetical protein